MWLVEADVTNSEIPQSDMILGTIEFTEMMQGRYIKRRIRDEPLDWIDYMHMVGLGAAADISHVVQPLLIFNDACGNSTGEQDQCDNASTEGNYEAFENISLADLDGSNGDLEIQPAKAVRDCGTQTVRQRSSHKQFCHMCKSKAHFHVDCPGRVTRDKKIAKIFDLMVINEIEISPNTDDNAVMPMKIEGHPALTLWVTGASCSLVSGAVVQQLGLEGNVAKTTKVAITCASGFVMHTQGTVDLRIEACGFTTMIRAQILKTMPSNYDMIFGWPDTRKLLAEKEDIAGGKPSLQTEDVVDYLYLGIPITRMLQKEICYGDNVCCHFENGTPPIVTVCVCGHESESIYESIVHHGTCRTATRQSMGIPKFICSCGIKFMSKAIWLAHQRDLHNNISEFVCLQQNCYHIVKDFEVAQEHSRAHKTWKQFETREVGEVLVFSCAGNEKALEGALMSTNPLIQIHELAYGKHLEPDQLLALKKLILRHENLFGTEEIPIVQAKVKRIEFVVIPDSKPVWQPVRRIRPKEREFVQKEIYQMVKDGRLEPSRSPWQSPIHLAPKGPDNKRLVGDYQKLNEVLVKPKYPIPLISDILDQLEGSRYFTTLDMTSGFQQLPVAEKSRNYLSIITTVRTFRPTTMPYGINSCGGLF